MGLIVWQQNTLKFAKMRWECYFEYLEAHGRHCAVNLYYSESFVGPSMVSLALPHKNNAHREEEYCIAATWKEENHINISSVNISAP